MRPSLRPIRADTGRQGWTRGARRGPARGRPEPQQRVRPIAGSGMPLANGGGLPFSKARRGPGFTLLEVLLSVTIGVVIMGGLYAAIGMTLRYADSGRQEVEEAQLARTIMNIVARDIRASLAPGTGPSQSRAASESGSDVESELSGLSSGKLNQGLSGDAQQLVVYTSVAPRGLDFSESFEALGGVAKFGDARRIQYFLQYSEDASDALGNPLPLGLSRLEGRYLTADTLDAQVGQELTDLTTTIIAPEVKQLAFRYFDGLEWYEQWPAGTASGLPRAVEIMMSVSPEPRNEEEAAEFERRQLAAAEAGGGGPGTYRLVVAIPSASPTSAGGDSQVTTGM